MNLDLNATGEEGTLAHKETKLQYISKKIEINT